MALAGKVALVTGGSRGIGGGPSCNSPARLANAVAFLETY